MIAGDGFHSHEFLTADNPNDETVAEDGDGNYQTKAETPENVHVAHLTVIDGQSGKLSLQVRHLLFHVYIVDINLSPSILRGGT